MPPIRCPHCDEAVAEDSTACPSCGQPLPRAARPWLWWLLLIVILSMLSLFVLRQYP